MSFPDSVRIYDTTLRDGSQAEDIGFSVEDKIRIAQKLDELGIHYVEGGWPGSNPKDLQFFQEIRSISLSQTKIVAFGSTCRAGTRPQDDPNIKALIETGTETVTIFGKSWDVHALHALNITLDQNLEIIYESIRFLKGRVPEVIFDAEHFFEFDQLNRLERMTRRNVPGAPDYSLTYTYDGTTNILSVADNFGFSVASAYDSRARLHARLWQGAGVDPVRA